MSILVQQQGVYAVVDGAHWLVDVDDDGRLIASSEDPDSVRHGFVKDPVVPVFERVVEPSEYEELYELRWSGRFRGMPVSVEVNRRGRVRVGVNDETVAGRLGFPYVDKFWWEIEVEIDDPRLELIPSRMPFDPSVRRTERRAPRPEGI